MERTLAAKALVLVLGSLALAGQATAQTVVDAGRRIDWSQVGIAGGVPARSTTCSTLSPGATVDQINAAIAACPSGQVVYLNAGTYNLASGIDFDNHSGVTLRGAGPDQTKLVFSKSINCSGMGGNVCIRNSKNDINWGGGPSHLADWTAGYAKDTTRITLSSTANLEVGSVLILDQLDDADTDTGGIWVCQTDNVCSDEGTGGGGREGRAQAQMTRVTAIDGNTVTISPGIAMPNFRAAQSPQAWWANTMITMSGIEDLAIDHSASDERSGIFFFNAYNCWVKNVKSVGANRNHVWFYLTAGAVVRDSYFYGTKNAASQSYGVENYGGSDNLVENNIVEHITAPLIDNGASTGMVYGYNYSIDDYYSVSPGWMMGSNLLHGAGTAMALHEGNEGAGFEPDDVHGTHNFITVLRNYFNGWETGKTAQTVPIDIYAFGRYMNIVGNVLGKAGYHDTYECNVSGSGWDTAIYRLGGETQTAPSDALVKTTLLRWGNYDTVTGAVQWKPEEIPSSLSQYANPVPSVQSVPDSYYLSGKPGWWPASIPWPPIGPDVAGGDGPGGHAYKNPAHVCYDNTAKDGSGILDFNAYNCYATGGTPVDGGPGDAAPADTRQGDIAVADASPGDRLVGDLAAADLAPIADAGRDVAAADSADATADTAAVPGPEPGSDSAVAPPADTPTMQPDLPGDDTAAAKADAPSGDTASQKDTGGGTTGGEGSSGCSCTVGGSRRPASFAILWPLGLLGLALWRRRCFRP
jgi:MYXO-CTERM domain-containing protein